ncbi:DNA/RNA non-specific endonuclease [Janthinobacterium sp. FT14W]|uniref:DNA/RNA non-specific endonuclease n=1 Tax=Janthinobacterium sp. FT14W TaxID=2654253 RepID=UPI00186AF9E4|nr:DNA/RNA non-specific endonuclease [Janthinobacterium sp. FT14W]
MKDFKGGTSAGNKGWVGVEKYRARYEVKSKDGKFSDSGAIEPLYNDFTNPEAGHVLGKQNGGNGRDPKNVFAQDGGTNNSKYKAFENRMRNALDLYDAKDKVKFVCYLAGSNIKQGVITDAGMDTASDISSDDDS